MTWTPRQKLANPAGQTCFFAGARIATVSQLGIGLTVAVALDATVVRIVLLPALMLLLGDRVWWLPRPLRRILPEIDLHGSRAG